MSQAYSRVDPHHSRYDRQVRFAPFGLKGQTRLAELHALVVGCGALGCGILNLLVRAGVGHVRFIDRDIVDEGNLHRQTLFSEKDAKERLPKAIAAEQRLTGINHHVSMEAVVGDFSHLNALELVKGMDVILDGTDNFEARYLLNELAVHQEIPYIHGACVGASGTGMMIIPGKTPCLRCLIPKPPSRGELPTCDTAGILGPTAAIVAAWEVGACLKWCAEGDSSRLTDMLHFDLWNAQWLPVDLKSARDPQCPTCGLRDFEWLKGMHASDAVSMCGRNMVQISVATADSEKSVDFSLLCDRLSPLGTVTVNPFLLTFCAGDYELMMFADGRCLVRGTTDPLQARAIFSRYFGY